MSRTALPSFASPAGIAGLSLLLGSVAPSVGLAQSGLSERPLQQCEAVAPLPRGVALRGSDVPLRIQADELMAVPSQPMRAEGAVRVSKGDQQLRTEAIFYDPISQRIEIPVWLHYRDAVIDIEADQARVDLAGASGEFSAVRYRLAGSDGSGSAGSVWLTDVDQVRLHDFSFTTCDPQRPDWQLIARDVSLDLEAGVGVARGARLLFYGVPLLATPYLSFPLTDQRKTGFLYPNLGYSSGDGFDISVPWYWNIAPHRDATFTPRWIEKRGVMLDSEFRFLGQRQAGQVNVAVLPDDRRRQADRYFGRFDHRIGLNGPFTQTWQLDTALRHASDEAYFFDLGSGLEDSAVQFLRSSTELRGSGQDWRLSLLADSFQVLDSGVLADSRPYRRLPRLQYWLNRPLSLPLSQAASLPLRLRLDSELVNFERRDRVTGARLDLLPRLSVDWSGAAWFVRPELGFRSTAYRLSNGQHNPSRHLPLASVDAGLFFDRPLDDGGTQTLAPRLFYLWVPHRDQSDLPVFDTAPLTFGLSQLFASNRFSGPDRQSDANQLAIALTTSRLAPGTARTVFDLSAGQIFYFEDRRVQLPGQPIDQRAQSATVLDGQWFPSERWQLGAGLQYDPSLNHIEQAEFRLGFQGRDQRQLALGYRYRRDRIDQVDARFRYPIGESVQLIGRVNYSFEDQDALELLGGIEYESCCWALTLTLREYVRDRQSEKRTAVFLVLHLKGLGSLGRQPYPLFGVREW